MENFCPSKNGYYLTKDVVPSGLFSFAWDVRNNNCVSTKLWEVPSSTPAMSVPDEPFLRFYSQLYAETRKLAFKNVKIREIEAWRDEAVDKLDRHQLHGFRRDVAQLPRR